MASKTDVNGIPRAVTLTVVLAIVLLWIFVRPYLSVVLLSTLIAFIFNPVYHWTFKKTKKNMIATSATLITAALTVIIPLTFILLVTINQVSTIIDNLNNGDVAVGSANIEQAVDRSIERVNHVISLLPGGTEVEISKENVVKTMQEIGVKLLNGLTNFVTSAGSAVSHLITTFILAIFMIIGMLKYQDELLAFVKRLSPFDDSINDVYLSRAASMTKAMVKGQFVIAAIQGFLSAGSLWLAGVDYFWFFLTILIFLSIIPLGAGIITIPIGIVFILTGNIPQGVFIILFHLLVVTNVDNILRPRLVPHDARLNSALLLLSVFSGIAIFGFIGVVFGPVLMVCLITALQVYGAYNEGRPRPKLKPLKPGRQSQSKSAIV